MLGADLELLTGRYDSMSSHCSTWTASTSRMPLDLQGCFSFAARRSGWILPQAKCTCEPDREIIENQVGSLKSSSHNRGPRLGKPKGLGALRRPCGSLQPHGPAVSKAALPLSYSACRRVMPLEAVRTTILSDTIILRRTSHS